MEYEKKYSYGELIRMGASPEEARTYLAGEAKMVMKGMAPEVLARPIKVEITSDELKHVRNALNHSKQIWREHEPVFEKFDKLWQEITSEALRKGRIFIK